MLLPLEYPNSLIPFHYKRELLWGLNVKVLDIFFYVLLNVHLDHLCNENQLDALFNPYFISSNILYMFRACLFSIIRRYSPYMYGNWYVLRWVHTCNVTAYRNAVTLQVTYTIRSCDMNFLPMPHDVTVSCERYTMGFPFCCGSQKHHECKEGERSGRW
jgi:hypothetical protein